MTTKDELRKTSYTDHQLAVIRWIQDLLSKDPTVDNRSLFAVTKENGGDVTLVSKLRGAAREEFGITRHARGGVIDVEKYVAAANIHWTTEFSSELHALTGWRLLNDPYAPTPVPREPKPVGRKRKRSLAETIHAAHLAGEDETFALLVREMRQVMVRTGIQSVTIGVGEVIVAQKVQVASVQKPEEAPVNGIVADET
jgi:hypothetical protein